MKDSRTRRIALMLLLAFGNAGCAGVTRTVRIDRPPGVAVTRVADLRLPRGTDSVVWLVSGEMVRGTWEATTQDRLELRSRDATGAIAKRSLDHADITLVARVVKMSKGARGWLGAAIGAIASLPFGISMFGDMMMPAAIVGALVGRGSGDLRAEVVFERPHAPPIR